LEVLLAQLLGEQNSQTPEDVTGGARVEGDVNTDGGDFVGRDKTVHAEGGLATGGGIFNSQIIIATADAIQRALRSKLSPEALQKAIAEYLTYLHTRYRYLNLKGMGVSDRVPLRLELLDLYVPLQARLELPKGETWERVTLAGRKLAEEQARLSKPRPVLEILQQHDGLIILGDPGAGKSTFLKYLALKLARGEGAELGLDGRLPVLLPLSAYANVLAEKEVRLDAFIAQHFTDTVSARPPIAQMLADALESGRALILLDGLDEVRDVNLRNTVVERVTDFYAAHRQAGNKFVLTSRIVGYRQVRPTAEGLGECTLVDFNDEEIAAFVERWTLALEKQAQGETEMARRDAEAERRELLDAVQHNPGVRRLAANPLLLTILALMKRQGVTLPERRVQLYDQYVTTLIATWNRARSLSGRAPGKGLDDVQTLRVLAPLALWMHREAPGVGLVKHPALLRRLTAIFAERGADDPEQAARRFLEDVHEHTALLLERGPDEYGFIHLTFEEYLAAVGLALQAEGEPQPVVEALAPYIGEQAWREVTLLTVAYIGIIQNLPGKAGQVAEGLAASGQGKPGEAALLAGEAVLDAWPDGVTPQSKEAVIAHLIPAMQQAEAAKEVRRRAGWVLGRLGWRPNDLDAFVPIPSGVFLMGSREDDEDAWNNEKPQRPVEIPYPFWMAKYPITNAQFARFVEAGGYREPRWWSKEGWWWKGEEKRAQPAYWDDRAWNNPIFPVVGVTFYEAEAYCRWLDEQLKQALGGQEVAERVAIADEAFWEALASGKYRLRLPTEEEWEYAARGTDGRVYPWGNTFEPWRANTREDGRVGTTAVCTYPQGVSPFGVWDLSGNVWEWVLGEYNWRGGSWSYNRRDARAAFRSRSDPSFFYNIVGFRVVFSLAKWG